MYAGWQWLQLFYLQALHVEEYQAQQEQKLVRELEAMVRIQNTLF